MTTQEIANRLVTLCRTGQSATAYQELFASDAVAYEMPGAPNAVTKGIPALLEKSKAWEDNINRVVRMEVTDPVVYGNYIAMGMGVQVEKTDGSLGNFEHEMCVYRVNDGKIVEERFIYAMPG